MNEIFDSMELASAIKNDKYYLKRLFTNETTYHEINCQTYIWVVKC